MGPSHGCATDARARHDDRRRHVPGDHGDGERGDARRLLRGDGHAIEAAGRAGRRRTADPEDVGPGGQVGEASAGACRDGPRGRSVARERRRRLSAVEPRERHVDRRRVPVGVRDLKSDMSPGRVRRDAEKRRRRRRGEHRVVALGQADVLVPHQDGAPRREEAVLVEGERHELVRGHGRQGERTIGAALRACARSGARGPLLADLDVRHVRPGRLVHVALEGHRRHRFAGVRAGPCAPTRACAQAAARAAAPHRPRRRDRQPHDHDFAHLLCSCGTPPKWPTFRRREGTRGDCEPGGTENRPGPLTAPGLRPMRSHGFLMLSAGGPPPSCRTGRSRAACRPGRSRRTGR